MFRKMLIPIDGSPISIRAATSGVGFAKEIDSEVVFLHAILPYLPPYNAELDVDSRAASLIEIATKEATADMLDTVEEIAKVKGVKYSSISEVSSHPEKLIDKTVRDLECDLIVIATHGRGAIGRFFLGSVTNRLLLIASVPVLIYRDQRVFDDFFE
jgi:nucleotide-binding universal stress UspA family protein